MIAAIDIGLKNMAYLRQFDPYGNLMFYNFSER